MNRFLTKPLVFVDFETTGTNPLRDRIIEVGILRVEDGIVVDEINTLINPQMKIPDQIIKMTGITPEKIYRAPPFEEELGKIREILIDSIFFAHNARFDYAFVKNEFARFENSYSAKVVCTVKLARALYPKLPAYNLDYLIKKFNLECKKRHRAYDDAYAIWQFYKMASRNKKPITIEKSFKKILKKPSLPMYLRDSDLDNLPESPGVYKFLGEGDLVLYIGKSTNIKDRVKSHFSSDYQNTRDLIMSKEIRKIEFTKTAGELGALIRESEMIKTQMPIFNRKLRRSKGLIAAVEQKTKTGYKKAEITSADNLDIKNLNKILGIFKNRKSAVEELYVIAKDSKLCPKLLGLEKGKGACFNFQIDKCLGACLGKEHHVKYNVRFSQTFAEKRVADWPYPSKITYREKNHELTESHIIDNWLYLGSVVESESGEKYQDEKHANFDWDTYKILKKFILGKKSKATINVPDRNYFFDYFQ